MPKFTRNLETVESNFDPDMLARICTMPEKAFGRAFGLEAFVVDQDGSDNFYFHRDNGASVLAVAHLDTVVYPDQREARFVETDLGLVVRSGALDDRLGAYTILDLLPNCGIEYDILLTVGEESGASTAAFFETDKEYDWLIEFDRGGTDVVTYQYECPETIAAVRRTGARHGDGIFSDISYMSHVGAKGWNWGVGYRDYHSQRGHAYIDDYTEMIARYLKFHQQNAGLSFPHDEADEPRWWTGYSSRSSKNWWDEDEYVASFEDDDHDFRGTGYSKSEIERYQEAGLWDMSDHEAGYHGHGFDEEPYSEGIYADADYIEDPTLEEIQRVLEKMDADEYRREQAG